MASFAFTARDDVGQTQTGMLDAASAALVAGQLRDRGWLVLRIQEHAEERTTAGGSGAWASLMRPRGVAVEMSLRQLAVMLRGGISLLSALETIASQSESRPLRAIYDDIIHQVQQGRSFSDALQKHTAFPDYLVRLVRVGEQTGIQETVLVRGADMMRTRRETLRDVATALTYPAIVLIAALGVTAYMVTSLVPKLTELLASLGKPLPAMTQSLVTFSGYFQQYGGTIALAVGASIIGFVLAYMSPNGRLMIDRVMLRVPILGRVLRLSGTLTFSQSLGTLVRSGVTVLDALVTVQQMHQNQFLAQCVQQSRDAIIRGNNLADTLRISHAYMPLLPTMTAVGEETGNLDEVMDEVTIFHQAQLTALIKTLGAWVTPAVVVSVGSVVGYVYIAFFMALFAVGS